jgi:hypothetical protein
MDPNSFLTRLDFSGFYADTGRPIAPLQITAGRPLRAAWTECCAGTVIGSAGCRFWATAMDVAEWLRGLGLEQYGPAFRDNHVDGEVLRRLTTEDLRELGVASIGHRRRLLDAVAAL